jgi:ATP-dependent Clp protease ATP-binding subunit ClpC
VDTNSNDPFVGAVLNDRYLIKGPLGAGRFGHVYLASDQQLPSKMVVVKILHQDVSREAWVRVKFKKGVEALCRVNHPGIVRALDQGIASDGSPFLVMDYVEGATLRSVIGAGGMDLERAGNLLRQVGQALGAAHHHGVFHCDLKPENIMVCSQTTAASGVDPGDETIRLIDFDVAKVTDSMVPGMTEGITAGTLAYMAPERFHGKAIAASDIFSMGVIAFELVTGARPFNSDAVGELMDLQRSGVRVNPKDLRHGLPAEAQNLILQSLAFNAEDRPQSAREFGEALARAMVEPDEQETRRTRVPGSRAEEVPTTARLQMAHVVSAELVFRSELNLDQLRLAHEKFLEIVNRSAEFREAQANREVVSLSQGESTDLVFHRDPLAAVQCAIEIAGEVKQLSDMVVRIGIHSGPVYRLMDINSSRNLSGIGIVVARQVMSLGESGHILLSQPVAEFLKQEGTFKACLHDLGLHRVKQSRLRLYNFYNDAIGNPETPGSHTRRRAAPRARRRPRAEEQEVQPRREETSRPAATPAQAAPPAHGIVTQILGVSHFRDDRGKEGLIYAQVPLAIDGVAPDPVIVRVKKPELQMQIQEVRRRIEDLTRRALVGHKRGNVGVEEAAAGLSSLVLPPTGLIGLLGSEVHPQFDLIHDVASEIPWEVLEEVYFCCPQCHSTQLAQQGQSTTPHCSSCGQKMRKEGGKLALRCHLSHLVRGPEQPASTGGEFLFIEDPTGDLCTPASDPHSICAQHLDELRAIVEKQGFTINLLQKNNATVTRVLNAIAKPAVAGIYYFGHGYFSRDGDEGCLVLSDGQLFASQIEKKAPAARLVFLNACEGASAGRDWDLEKRSRSVAQAFARGGRGKTVIAPLWPVVNVQAAETALEFFRHAEPDTPMAYAMENARRVSLDRYKANEPHLSWMAYRYFGDPNNPFPAPRAGIRSASQLFDTDGQLKLDAFSFGIEDVLIRAAKRRNLQDRMLLTVTDFLSGLIRKGDLTRFVFQREGLNPDEVYETLTMQVEPGAPAADSAPGEESLRESLSRWIVRRREEFSPNLLRILEAVAQRGQGLSHATGDNRVSEHDLLAVMAAGDTWREGIPITSPTALRVNYWLRQRESSGKVDANGCITLARLDAKARRIIESAHNLSQQRGTFPIPHRLMLAALLEDDQGYGARVCRSKGTDPHMVFLLMLAVSDSVGEHSPRSFGLSSEACQRIVLPTLDAAERLAGGNNIGERELFRAFCEQANSEFKELLRDSPAPFDLDELIDIDPDREEILASLDGGGRRIVTQAHELAQAHGVSPIPNRIVLAAFLTDSTGAAAKLLASAGIPSEAVRVELLRTIRRQPPMGFPLDVKACDRAVLPMIERAKELAGPGTIVTETCLFRAFCQTLPSGFKAQLKASSPSIDLDMLGSLEPAAGKPGAPLTTPPEVPPALKPLGGVPPAPPAPPEGPLFENPEFSPEQFVAAAWRILNQSADVARERGWPEIRTPHLFAALLESESVRRRLSLDGNAPLAELKELILSVTPPQPPVPTSAKVSFGQHAREVIQRSLEIGAGQKRERATEDDLLAAFMEDQGGVITQVLQVAGLTGPPAASGFGEMLSMPSSRPSVLSEFGVDLTERARGGKLLEIVGRDNEIATALETLLLTENANPLLVGEAGVGKTAIVEGIAQLVAEGRCPKRLQSASIIELASGGLVANTRFRGEFEQRIQKVIEEAKQPNIILFIDEIHTIVGAGSGEGSGPDAGDMLKTALARGEIRLIGATTPGEFKRTIERDHALSRRFQVQMIHPPSREATLQVLTARQARFEREHQVTISESAKEAAVDLSGRYILDRQWPAKARDLLERACIFAVSQSLNADMPTVSTNDVARVVARQTGIPLERLRVADLDALGNLETKLGKHIIGQENAIRTVANAIRRGRQGLAGANRPWGVFLFVGPPGVGKTEVARELAEQVYGGANGLIRFDMGDFTEPHSTARLIGAPPGYVGYDQGAPLIDRLRRQPYSLILFDEIEHAHENVLAVLLRLLSEGTMTDQDGNTADATNTVIILTSNLLTAQEDAKRYGFATQQPLQSSDAELRVSLQRRLPAKLIDRMDSIVWFNELSEESLTKIARQKVSELVTRMCSMHAIQIDVADEVFSWIALKALEGGRGARHIQRTVDDSLGPPLMAALAAIKPGASTRLELSVAPSGIGVECTLQHSSPEMV